MLTSEITLPFLVEEFVPRLMNCYVVTSWTSGISGVVSATGHSRRVGTVRECPPLDILGE